jgi:hypothetical protein
LQYYPEDKSALQIKPMLEKAVNGGGSNQSSKQPQPSSSKLAEGSSKAKK